jgi:hypothetical protein
VTWLLDNGLGLNDHFGKANRCSGLAGRAGVLLYDLT